MLATRKRTKLSQHLEASELADKLRAQDWGYESIAKEINNKFDMTISRTSVISYFEKKEQNMGKILAHSEEDKRKAIDCIRDISDQVKILNEDMWKIYNSVDKDDSASVIAGQNQIIKLLQFQQGRLDSLDRIVVSAQQTNVNVDIVNMAVRTNTIVEKKMKEHITDLEKRGIIKILRPEDLE
ncbi:hypothetical protein HQ529_03680 [Candidatus Woesearchaeota archaeon]|nr:hypothetical protein [Candidatus Woesearchaeota archaeon]